GVGLAPGGLAAGALTSLLTAPAAGLLPAGLRGTRGLSALLATPAALLTAAPLGLGHLGGGVAQRRADLVDLHLHDGAVLALLGLPGARHQPAGHDDTRAAGE